MTNTHKQGSGRFVSWLLLGSGPAMRMFAESAAPASQRWQETECAARTRVVVKARSVCWHSDGGTWHRIRHDAQPRNEVPLWRPEVDELRNVVCMLASAVKWRTSTAVPQLISDCRTMERIVEWNVEEPELKVKEETTVLAVQEKVIGHRIREALAPLLLEQEIVREMPKVQVVERMQKQIVEHIVKIPIVLELELVHESPEVLVAARMQEHMLENYRENAHCAAAGDRSMEFQRFQSWRTQARTKRSRGQSPRPTTIHLCWRRMSLPC